MQRSRFFLLDKRLPKSEIPDMLCRVVASKQDPLDAYAPSELLPPNVPRHNPADILPISSIPFPPPPTASVARRDFVAHTHGASFRASLTSLLGLDVSHNTTQRVSLESDRVLQYTLKNPDEYFEVLMADELYAADVKGLVERKGKGFFVTGFLTAEGTRWKVERGTKKGVKLKATVPVAAALAGGVPLQGLGLDPEFAPEVHDEVEAGKEMYVAEEQIFAVAYSVVKISVVGLGDRKKKEKLLKEKVVVGPPSRSKRGELAMGSKGDGEVVESSEDEDVDGGEGVALESMGADEGGFEVDGM